LAQVLVVVTHGMSYSTSRILKFDFSPAYFRADVKSPLSINLDMTNSAKKVLLTCM